jgi:putative transposase
MMAIGRAAMARMGRYFVANQPLHVIQRGNNRQAVFFEDQDYGLYHEWLAFAARRNGCAIHAYVLMTNHVHLLVTPSDKNSLPRMMQSLGRRYVRMVNSRYCRTGTLWEGRYKAAPLDSDSYFLACSRYVELNPVRARMVSDPADYPFSSYRANAFGQADALISKHPLLSRLGTDSVAQQAAYRALFRERMDEQFVDALRAATNGGWALGNSKFKAEIAEAAERRASPLPKGRPLKARQDKRQLCLL